jgi:endonuclease III-like uncharacterized protein
MKMTIEDKVKLLANYIKTLSDFEIIEPDIPYCHTGATITDAILQAGTTWETVVRPRVHGLIHKYSEARTTTGFLKLLENVGPRELLKWNDPEKTNRILEVARFFAEEGIETEADLKTWLENETNIKRLKKLRGIGDKTADYFRLLCGIPTSAVDRHLSKFLNRAGISPSNYSEAKEIINKAAEQMGIDKSVLDHSIWKYMSSRKGRKLCK